MQRASVQPIKWSDKKQVVPGLTEKDIEMLCSKVAVKSRIRDFAEAYGYACVGFAYGLSTYNPNMKTKLTTYCTKCAIQECQTERNRILTKRRGWTYKTASLDVLREKGYEVDSNEKLVLDRRAE